MSSIGVKHLSVEEGLKDNPALTRYASKLAKLDKDGNGQLDLAEICEAVENLVESEKQNRFLKKVSMLLGLVSLLTIAATVGLTAAVVVLSKDTESSNGALVDKDSGNALATGQYYQTSSITDLLQNKDRTPAFLASLSNIKSVTTPGSEPNSYTLHTVASYTMYPDGSISFTTVSGQDVKYSLGADGQVVQHISTIPVVCEASEAPEDTTTTIDPAAGTVPEGTVVEGDAAASAATRRLMAKPQRIAPAPAPAPEKSTEPDGGDGLVTCMVCSETCMSGCLVSDGGGFIVE